MPAGRLTPRLVSTVLRYWRGASIDIRLESALAKAMAAKRGRMMMRYVGSGRVRLAFALSALTLATAPDIARAEPPSSHAPTSPEAKPVEAGGAKAASPAAGEEASTHFKRGLQLFDEGDYTLALVEFERAYQLAPNYRALYNIALVDMQLGRYADAARTLEQYVTDGGGAIPAARQAEVRKSLSELKLRTATVEISLSVPGAEVTLDGKPIDPSIYKAPMVIDAGEHTLRATSPGYSAANRTVTLAGADRAAVRLELVPLSSRVSIDNGEHRAFFWPGLAAAGGLAAGAIVSGAVMLDARSHLTNLQNSPDSSIADRQTWANRNNSAALAADIFSGAAAVAGGITIYLSLRLDHSAKSPAVAISPRQIALSEPF